MPEYRIFRNDEVVLIRTPTSEIEISCVDADALGRALMAKPKRLHQHYTEKEGARAIELYREGASFAEIGAELGRTPASINVYLNRQKVVRTRSKRRASQCVVAAIR